MPGPRSRRPKKQGNLGVRAFRCTYCPLFPVSSVQLYIPDIPGTLESVLIPTPFQDAASPSIRNACATTLLLISLGTSPAFAANDAPSPPLIGAATDAVKSTLSELTQILENQEQQGLGAAEQGRQKIERVIMRRVSYEEMAKRALGTPWSELPETDRREFVELFVQLLRDNFAGRISEHSLAAVSYLGEEHDRHFAEVKTQFKNPKVDTQIDFRLLLQSGDWLVYDVVVDGVSIVSNYRAQFTSIIRDVSYAGLVEKMKQRPVAVKIFERTPAR